MSQKVFGSNFSKNKYFYLNPKAYEQACSWLSFPLLDIKNGPLSKKLSRFFVRGGGGRQIVEHSLYPVYTDELQESSVYLCDFFDKTNPKTFQTALPSR